MSDQHKLDKAKKHMEKCGCQAVYMTSDGQIFHEDAKHYASSHRLKIGGDLLHVKLEDLEQKEEKVEMPESQEDKKEVQPKKTYKKRARRSSK